MTLPRFLVLLVFCLSACSFHIASPQLDNTYTFSDGFTDHQKDIVRQGLSIWPRDTGGRVTFVEVPSHGNFIIIAGTEAEAIAREVQLNEHFPPNEQEHVIGMTSWENGELFLFIGRINDDNSLLQVTAHEAGHEIGLIHIPQGEVALMNPALQPLLLGDAHLTKYDINQFCQYWGCTNDNPTLPSKN